MDPRQNRDAKTFGSFLRSSKLGTKWAPLVHTNWQFYKEVIGAAKEETRTDTEKLPEGQVRYWYGTKYSTMWYCEVRVKDTNQLVAAYLYHYFDEGL